MTRRPVQAKVWARWTRVWCLDELDGRRGWACAPGIFRLGPLDQDATSAGPGARGEAGRCSGNPVTEEPQEQKTGSIDIGFWVVLASCQLEATWNRCYCIEPLLRLCCGKLSSRTESRSVVVPVAVGVASKSLPLRDSNASNTAKVVLAKCRNSNAT